MLRFVAVFAVMPFALGVVPPPQDDVSKKELKKLQGTWQLVSAEENDQAIPDDIIQNLRIVIKGNHLTLKGVEDLMAKFGKITLTVDPGAMPKIIDFKIEAGSEKDRTFEGIYELKKGRLRICASTIGGNRPNEFKSTADSNRVLFELKLEKE